MRSSFTDQRPARRATRVAPLLLAIATLLPPGTCGAAEMRQPSPAGTAASAPTSQPASPPLLPPLLPPSDGTPHLTLATGTEPDSSDGRWLRRIFTEAFRRLGWRLEVQVMPARRAELALERGEVDGEMVRTALYGAQHPALQRVETPLLQVSFGVYGAPGAARPTTLEALRDGGGQVIYRRGVTVCEQRLREVLPAERLVEISAADSAVRMLARGRVGFVCDMDSALSLSLAHLGSIEGPARPMQRLFDLGPPVAAYPFLHARHAALAPRLAATLQTLRAEGWLTPPRDPGAAARPASR